MAVDPKVNRLRQALEESLSGMTASTGGASLQANVPSVVPEQQRTINAPEEGGGDGRLKQFMADFVVSLAAGQNPIFGAMALGIKRRREEEEEETNRLAFEASQAASKRAIESQGVGQVGPARSRVSTTTTVSEETGLRTLSTTLTGIPSTSVERFTDALNLTGSLADATNAAP